MIFHRGQFPWEAVLCTVDTSSKPLPSCEDRYLPTMPKHPLWAKLFPADNYCYKSMAGSGTLMEKPVKPLKRQEGEKALFVRYSLNASQAISLSLHNHILSNSRFFRTSQKTLSDYAKGQTEDSASKDQTESYQQLNTLCIRCQDKSPPSNPMFRISNTSFFGFVLLFLFLELYPQPVPTRS